MGCKDQISIFFQIQISQHYPKEGGVSTYGIFNILEWNKLLQLNKNVLDLKWFLVF